MVDYFPAAEIRDECTSNDPKEGMEASGSQSQGSPGSRRVAV
jgi:hypothetical protein